MHEHAFDVAVVGAGPAGTTAAWALARTGRRVVLFEKHALPRYKTCGGGVVVRARKWLPPLEASAFETLASRASLHLHRADGRDLDFESPTTLTVDLAMRATLDQALVEAAVGAGAELREATQVNGVRVERERVVVASSRGEVGARYVLIADGATGATARLAGWSEPHHGIAALEWELRVDDATWTRFRERTRFDFGDVERGYAWVFAKRAHLSVGVLTTRRGKAELATDLERYLARLGIVPREVERHGFVIPLRPRREGAVRGRVMLLGDAAGLADPVTAEGISHAAHSARLAARAIEEGDDDVDRTGALYRRSLEAQILGELVWARRVARVLYRRSTREWLLSRVGDEFVAAMSSIVAGTTTYRELLLQPRHYWGLFRRGARRAKSIASAP
ncbi:MAG: NAD(P)/FAD-dependent oxidoreductase [Planctomycetes bacterium]|nr:NAD(P)/FAD-dependent oxidoreductase [Planctomycetota bacterium]